MATPIQRACRLLKRRVLFINAKLTGSRIDEEHDIERIRLATEFYTQTWILPLLEAIEQGDTARLLELL